MRVAIFCAAMVLAVTGVAVAKEKRVVVSEAGASCAAKPSAKVNNKHVPKLDCKSTGTVAAKSVENGAKASGPRLGYDANPWIVSGF